MLKQIINWTWCLPQNLVGTILFLFVRKEQIDKYNDALVIRWRYKSGVSLGRFIFVSKNANETTIKHEYGHTLQSYRLSWLYLIIVGLPSIIWAGLFGKYRKKHNISYYSIFPENWADKLGGVKRR